MKHFRIHKALLCSKIPYFDKMFNSGFREGKENIAELPEDDAESFDILHEWVYTATLPKFYWIKEPGKSVLCSYNYHKLLILLDKLCLNYLKDQVASDVLDDSEAQNMLPGMVNLGLIIDTLPETSAFREYFVLSLLFILNGLSRNDSHLKTWPAQGFADLLVDHPKVALAYFKALRDAPIGSIAEDPRKMPRCKFHEHGEDEECPVKKRDQH